MPLHQGHMHLIETAAGMVKELTILVCSLEDEPIPGEVWYQWVKNAFPAANVLHNTDPNPSYPEDDPDFWNIWKKSITNHMKTSLDVVFTSDDYGLELAEKLDAEFFQIDPGRSVFPVSGTAIRSNPFSNWDFLPEQVRAWYAFRVVVIGAESTGKTTLARDLAQHFSTAWLPEYGREYIDEKNAPPELEDIMKIAVEHVRREDVLAQKANKVLICDTDLIVTSILSEYYFKTCPGWVADESHRRKYSLYVFTDIDIPWEEDAIQREGPEEREMLHVRFLAELVSRKLDFITVSGTPEQRLKKAAQEIEMRMKRA